MVSAVFKSSLKKTYKSALTCFRSMEVIKEIFSFTCEHSKRMSAQNQRKNVEEKHKAL